MSDADIRKAEQQVRRSANQFELAIEHLEETVEDGKHRVNQVIENVQDKINMPKRVFHNAKKEMRNVLDQGQEFLSAYALRIWNSLRTYYFDFRSVVLSRVQRIQRTQINSKVILAAVGSVALVGGVILGLRVYFRRDRNLVEIDMIEMDPIIALTKDEEISQSREKKIA